MRLLFWKAFVGLLAYDALLFGRSFSRLHRTVQRWPIARKSNTSAATVDLVCNAINHALIWYPKRVLCLQRASVTTCLLRSQGVLAQLVLGAQRTPFKAHAWVEVNRQAVNERSDVQATYSVWDRC